MLKTHVTRSKLPHFVGSWFKRHLHSGWVTLSIGRLPIHPYVYWLVTCSRKLEEKEARRFIDSFWWLQQAWASEEIFRIKKIFLCWSGPLALVSWSSWSCWSLHVMSPPYRSLISFSSLVLWPSSPLPCLLSLSILDSSLCMIIGRLLLWFIKGTLEVKLPTI